jgi:hypothetical protein
VDLKAPLGMLKFRMQMKAEQNDGFKVFSEELNIVTGEQTAFLDKLEYHVAKAENIDPVQAIIFKINNRYMISPPRSFLYVSPYAHMLGVFHLSLLIHTCVYICTQCT